MHRLWQAGPVPRNCRVEASGLLDHNVRCQKLRSAKAKNVNQRTARAKTTGCRLRDFQDEASRRARPGNQCSARDVRQVLLGRSDSLRDPYRGGARRHEPHPALLEGIRPAGEPGTRHTPAFEQAASFALPYVLSRCFYREPCSSRERRRQKQCSERSVRGASGDFSASGCAGKARREPLGGVHFFEADQDENRGPVLRPAPAIFVARTSAPTLPARD